MKFNVLKVHKNNFQPKAQKLNISTFQLLNNKTIATWRMLSNLRFYISSWWFQPIWKYLSNWIISPGRDENKTYLKPPPRFYRGSFWGLINKPRQNHPLQKVHFVPKILPQLRKNHSSSFPFPPPGFGELKLYMAKSFPPTKTRECPFSMGT